MVKAIRRHHSLCFYDLCSRQKPVLNLRPAKNAGCKSSKKKWNAIIHAKRNRTAEKTRQMKSCKAVSWLFPLITNAGLF